MFNVHSPFFAAAVSIVLWPATVVAAATAALSLLLMLLMEGNLLIN